MNDGRVMPVTVDECLPGHQDYKGKSFTKVVMIGTIPVGKGWATVYCRIDVVDKGKGPALSISGVEGPLKNGECVGGCGQIVLSLSEGVESITPAEGWSHSLIREFFYVWDQWHLNDMRAGCEHQRKGLWGKCMLTVNTYKLKQELRDRQREIQNRSQKLLIENKTVSITDEEQTVLLMPYEVKAPAEEMYKSIWSFLEKDYVEVSRETKTSGWFYQSDHPEGVLCKPCTVCGYKYGSEWLYESLPQKVVDFLKALPDSDTVPPWV